MDWPAFVAASGGVLGGFTALLALIAKLREKRRRQIEAERRAARGVEIDDIWRAVQDLADRVRDLETADVIARHDAPSTRRR